MSKKVGIILISLLFLIYSGFSFFGIFDLNEITPYEGLVVLSERILNFTDTIYDTTSKVINFIENLMSTEDNVWVWSIGYGESFANWVKSLFS